MASKQVNLSKYMSDTKKTIADNRKPVPKDIDEAHNIKEALNHKSRVKGTGYIGTDAYSGKSYYANPSGAYTIVKPGKKVVKNPIKKK